jgi:hypothetical protein
MTRYGLLDESGEVIRWVWERPPAGVPYITEYTRLAPRVDWDDFEEALF